MKLRGRIYEGKRRPKLGLAKNADPKVRMKVERDWSLALQKNMTAAKAHSRVKAKAARAMRKANR